MRVDAHQHFWRYDPVEYDWIGDAMQVLKRDFLPHDLAPELTAFEMDGSIAVQARQTLEETRWLLELAQESELILGVVGWVDLRDPEVDTALDELASERLLVGVRHVVEGEPEDDFVLGEEFQRGIGKLAARGLVYDLLTLPHQLASAIELVRRFPDQPFVLDHLSKPSIKDGTLAPWDAQMRELGSMENVACKVSGMVTEADWSGWKSEDFHPYLDLVMQAFGEDRVLFGSDWPVCLLAADYAAMASIANDYAGRLSDSSRAKLFGENAVRIYGLKR